MVVKALLDSDLLSSLGFGLSECFYPKGRSMKPVSLVSKEIRIKKAQKCWLEFETTVFHSFLKAAQAGLLILLMAQLLKTLVLHTYTSAIKPKL